MAKQQASVSGWARPKSARLAHFFGAGANRSACGSWWYLGQELKPHPPAFPCTRCERAAFKAVGHG